MRGRGCRRRRFAGWWRGRTCAWQRVQAMQRIRFLRRGPAACLSSQRALPFLPRSLWPDAATVRNDEGPAVASP